MLRQRERAQSQFNVLYSMLGRVVARHNREAKRLERIRLRKEKGVTWAAIENDVRLRPRWRAERASEVAMQATRWGVSVETLRTNDVGSNASNTSIDRVLRHGLLCCKGVCECTVV